LNGQLAKEKKIEDEKETETRFLLTTTLDSLKQYKKQENLKDEELKRLAKVEEDQ